jgi:hypothetical protein
VIQNDILGIKVDQKELEKVVSKIKKTINLECNTLPLIDEDLLVMKKKQEMEAQEANLKLSEETKREIANLDMKLTLGLKDIPGVFVDEITLLTCVAIKFFQCFLEMDYV